MTETYVKPMSKFMKKTIYYLTNVKTIALSLLWVSYIRQSHGLLK